MSKVGIYLVCDYRNEEEFLNSVEVCQRCDIDFLEVGIPFSDPVADGPVIEKAAFNILNKRKKADFFSSLEKAREIFKKKFYIMTYANVVFGYGSEKFAEKTAFIDGIILADVPFKESEIFEKVFRKYNTNLIHFITPESSYDDIDKVKKVSKDFIYFVSTRGITGGKFNLDNETYDKIRYAQKDFDKDIVLGFGIRTKEDVEKACRVANAVVIGTKAVEAINENSFERFIKDLV